VKLHDDEDGTVHLDLSLVYNHNGLAEYVTEGGLRELPGGGWVADPVASDANLMTYRVGIHLCQEGLGEPHLDRNKPHTQGEVTP